MRNRNILVKLALVLGLPITALATAATAADISGKSDLICAASHVVGCIDGECMQGTPKTFELMTFIYVDVSRKVVHGVDDAGKKAESPIKSFEVTENSIILQGFENHRGWTIGIDRKDRGLNMSSTGPDVNFMITGNCTER